MTSTDYTAALIQADVSDALGVVAALQTAAHRSLAPFTPLKDPYYKLNHDLLLRAADLIRALTAQTVLDTTTGIWNRRYFDQRLEQEISEAKRYSRPLSLVFCDIDWFKKLNDQFGHQFADSVLEKIAQILSSGRISDIACRCGGEEFGIILPSTNAEQGKEVVERLRAAIESVVWPDHTGLVVTASFGICDMECLSGEVTAKELFKTADNALYTAKNSGRNKVMQYTPKSAEAHVWTLEEILRNEG